MRSLALALRNLLRNRRRSLATLFAIAVGTVAILLFWGYSRQINYGLQTGFVRGSGHLQVQRKDYFLYGSGNPAAYGIGDYRRVMDIIRRDAVLAPMLTVVTSTLELGGIAGNFAAGVSRTVLASGIVVEDQNEMQKWNDYGFPGNPQRLALTDTAPDAAMVGVGVARVLQLCAPLHVPECRQIHEPAADHAASTLPATLPADLATLSSTDDAGSSEHASLHAGTRIEMLAATARGAPNVASLAVVKAQSQGVKELDDISVAMHLAQAQHLIYGADPPQVTAIVLQLKHTAQMPAARLRLQQLLTTTLQGAALEVQEFTTLNPFYGQTIGLFASIFGFIAVLIGVIVLFTVGNTMSTAVLERTTEIGTLRAMGLRRSGIRRIFICEGLLLGVGGAVAGAAAALLSAQMINHSGLMWTPPGRVDAVPLSVRLWGEWSTMIRVMIGLTLVTVVSSWWPARRAARTNIVEALRHA
jgi:putative ABC transport system permease protein